MKKIRRRTRNKIIATISTLSVLVLGVIMVTVFTKADGYHGLPTYLENFLGENVRYGVIANSVKQGSHVNTNFAAGKYEGNGSGCAALDNGKTSETLIGEITNKIYFDNDKSILRTGTNDRSKITGNIKDSNITYGDSAKIQSEVENMIKKAAAQGAADVDKSTFELPEVKDKAVIDLTKAKGEDKVVATTVSGVTKVPYETTVPTTLYTKVPVVSDGEEPVAESADAPEGEEGEAPQTEENLTPAETEVPYETTVPVSGETEVPYETSDVTTEPGKLQGVVYLKGFEPFLSTNHVIIKKTPEQVVVINISTSDEVAIKNVEVVDPDGNRYQKSVDGKLAASVIFNIPNSKKVTLDSGFTQSMTIIAPNATVDNKQCQEGWIVCNEFINSNEWHTPKFDVPTPTPNTTTPPTETEPPTTEYKIDVTKAVDGVWPDGAEFKFDLSFDKNKNHGSLDCIDYKEGSVYINNDTPEHTQSFRTIKFDLSKFTGYESGYYSNKTVDGKTRGYVECCEYNFTVKEDSAYRPTDTKGVDYDLIEYDTTPRHIKIWVNVEKDADGNIVDYWLEPREALGDAWCTARKGATEFTNKVNTPPETPRKEYTIDVAKAFVGEWPDNAVFEAKIKFDAGKSNGNSECIDYTGLKSVYLTKDNPTQSMGTIKFDLSKFTGGESGYYSNKTVDGKTRGYVECCEYMFTVTEESTYRPKDTKGVDYDEIVYDTTPRHIKIWVNVEKDKKDGKIVDYWLEPKEAKGDAGCTKREGATTFTNRLKPKTSYDIDVTKAFEGEWPNGAEFKFDLSFDKNKNHGSLDCIDYKEGSVYINNDTPKHTQSFRTIKFDLSKFTGYESDDYSNKTVDGKTRGYVECCEYNFTVKEDSTYRPTDTKGVDYDAIVYDTTPRHIKIWVNVEKDKDGNIVDYWLEPREALHRANSNGECDGEICDARKGATTFTNKLKVVTTTTPPTATPTTTPTTTATPPTVVTTTTPPTVVTTTTPPTVVETTTPPTTEAPTATPVTVEQFVPLAPATPEPTPEQVEVPNNDVPLAAKTPKPTKTPLEKVNQQVPLSAVPETGDSMNPIIPIAGMGISFLAIIGVVVLRKKKTN